MSDVRTLSREEKALKSVTGALVEALGGTKACLQILRAHEHTPSATLFYAYCDHNDARHFMPIHYVSILERTLGRPVVTSHNAAELGAEIVPGPEKGGDETPIDADAAIDAIRSLCRKSGGLKIGLDEAAADGVIDAAERQALRRQAHQLLSFVWRLVLRLERS